MLEQKKMKDNKDITLYIFCNTQGWRGQRVVVGAQDMTIAAPDSF